MRNPHPSPSPVRFAESGNAADRAGLLTLPAAATTLAISKRTLERLIASGEFPRPVKIGRASRVLSSDLAHYLEQLRRKRGDIIGNS
ncbi:MAG TPA: helix-turn-helix domain-containing protein [Opitutaceae bacterium]|nr:helix-turn-helix domain-containing protein [Opitutaceae bacterium]HRJ47995.1 helix-turn-helix domain-containing protein [Opitutaceae bacterium]